MPSSQPDRHCSLILTCDTVANFAATYVADASIKHILDLLLMSLDGNGEYSILVASPFSRPKHLGVTLLHRAAAVDSIYAAN